MKRSNKVEHAPMVMSLTGSAAPPGLTPSGITLMGMLMSRIWLCLIEGRTRQGVIDREAFATGAGSGHIEELPTIPQGQSIAKIRPVESTTKLPDGKGCQPEPFSWARVMAHWRVEKFGWLKRIDPAAGVSNC